MLCGFPIPFLTILFSIVYLLVTVQLPIDSSNQIIFFSEPTIFVQQNSFQMNSNIPSFI